MSDKGIGEGIHLISAGKLFANGKQQKKIKFTSKLDGIKKIIELTISSLLIIQVFA